MNYEIMSWAAAAAFPVAFSYFATLLKYGRQGGNSHASKRWWSFKLARALTSANILALHYVASLKIPRLLSLASDF